MANKLLTLEEAAKLLCDVLDEHAAKLPEAERPEFYLAAGRDLQTVIGGFPPIDPPTKKSA